MIKQVLLLVLFSIAAIFLKTQLDALLNVFVSLHNLVIHYLSLVFSNAGTGRIVQAVLALLIIPAALVGVVSAVYWAVKRSMMPYAIHLVWISWLVMLTTFTLKGV